jgi:hypothetical protein
MQRLQDFPAAMPRSPLHGFAGLRSLGLLACLGAVLAGPACATNTAGAAVFDAHAVEPLAGTARQEQVVSAMDAEGRSVTVWLDRRGTSQHLRLQRHDAAGLPYGEPIQVNNTAIVGSYAYPQVAMSADGAFTVVWTQTESWLGGMPHVFRRSFDRHGQALTYEQRVDPPGTPEAGSAQIAMRSDGSHSIAWLSYPGSGQRALYLTGFDANGMSLGAPQLIASGTSSTQLGWPRLAMDDGGNVLAVWSENRGGAGEEVWMRRRLANGTLATITRVNSLAPATVPRPDVAMDAAGDSTTARSGCASSPSACCPAALAQAVRSSSPRASPTRRKSLRIRTLPWRARPAISQRCGDAPMVTSMSATSMPTAARSGRSGPARREVREPTTPTWRWTPMATPRWFGNPSFRRSPIRMPSSAASPASRRSTSALGCNTSRATSQPQGFASTRSSCAAV